MRLPKIQGVIRRRILVNYRVDPGVIQRLLPERFRPKLHAGSAVAGICLIRLEQIRPRGWPSFLGLSSENAAHRIAVRWDGDQEGVFIPRRDTNSTLNYLAGGRLFPGEHNAADFKVTNSGEVIDFKMKSRDGSAAVELKARVTNCWGGQSQFATLAEASDFFEPGSMGYSVTKEANRLDGLRLATRTWKVEPLEVERAFSSYFSDQSKFPPGSVIFDCALLMRNIEHEWHEEPDLYV
jgi:uncharacterized protein YqjF (DUF2071 family)